MIELLDGQPRWHGRAACRGADPELFFPDQHAARRRPSPVVTAKNLCHGCEVRDDCLEDALARRERYGIWGGLNERERRGLLRRRPRHQ